MQQQIIQGIIDVLKFLASVMGIFYFNRGIYALVGFFATRKFPEARNKHKYAIMIAARNEEPVVGNLIASIRAQDYPADLIDIFVVADNCTDNTARVARQAGAVCYERFDTQHRTKGYALQFLVEQIRRDYGIDHYEAYLVFDADNLLKQDYMSRMNEAFDAGAKIVTSYRNTKNFDSNWIAASYAIHWLRTTRTEHRARSLFHLAARVQGTGYLFSWELIKDGWTHTGLTEDRSFCAEAVAQGYSISYADRAEFFDEQPENLRIALRQRLRWSKGHLLVMIETCPKLLKHMFFTRKCARSDKSQPLWKRFVRNIHLRYMSADMFSVAFPRGLTSLLRRIVIYLLRLYMVFATGYVVTVAIAPSLVRDISQLLDTPIAPGTPGAHALWLSAFFFLNFLISEVKQMGVAAYVLFMERKRILHVSFWKKVWYCFTFPVFDLIGKFTSVAALFTRVEWKPIPHNASISIEEVAEKQK